MPFIVAQLVLFVLLGCQFAQVVKTSPDNNSNQINTYSTHYRFQPGGFQ